MGTVSYYSKVWERTEWLHVFGYKDFSFDNRYRMNRETHVNYVMHLIPTVQIFYRDG